MPWCPVCREEYREGFGVCADCGARLTDRKLDSQREGQAVSKQTLLVAVDSAGEAGRIRHHLEKAGIFAQVEPRGTMETKQVFGILVPAGERAEAERQMLFLNRTLPREAPAPAEPDSLGTVMRRERDKRKSARTPGNLGFDLKYLWNKLTGRW